MVDFVSAASSTPHPSPLPAGATAEAKITRDAVMSSALQRLQAIDPQGALFVAGHIQPRVEKIQAAQQERESKRLQAIVDRFEKQDILPEIVNALLATGRKHAAARPAAAQMMRRALDTHDAYRLDDPLRWRALRVICNDAAELQSAYAQFRPIDTRAAIDAAPSVPPKLLLPTKNSDSSELLVGAGLWLSGIVSASAGQREGDWGQRHAIIRLGFEWGAGLGAVV